MAVVTATEQSEIVGYPFKIASGTVAAQNDCLKFPEVGVIPFFVNIQYNKTGAATSGGSNVEWKYAEVAVTASGACASTVTTINYDGGTANERTTGSYYARNSRTGECMFVKADSGSTTTTGDLTVVRGCLGTAAAAVLENDYLYCMNSMVMTGAATGTALVGYYELPELHKATFF